LDYFDRAVLWLRALFRRARVESETEKEMRLHLEMEFENNIRQGMSPPDAKRAALVAFGGVEVAKDAVRDERGTQWLEHTMHDIRFALRGFRTHPVFAVGVVVVIALGIGPNTAIFSIIEKLLIAPLPYPDGNQMVDLLVTSHRGQFRLEATADQVDRWRASARTVDQITTFDARSFELGDPTLAPTESVAGALLTPGTMAFVGARPVLGRNVMATDTLANAAPVALISYALWQRLFGGRSDAIGQVLVVDENRTTIVGVMPQGFSLPFRGGGEIFPATRSGSPSRPVDAVAKLKPGVSITTANRELASIFAQADSTTDTPRLERAVDQNREGAAYIVFLMFGAVTIVLLIACANVANLMLARAWDRQREFAVRTAMGAGRARLVRQVLTESVTLALAGAALDIAVAWTTLRLLTLALPGANGPFAGIGLQPVILLWTLALTIVVALAFGLAPALFAAGNRPSDALKAGARAASSSRSSRRARSILVVAEIALSAMLLIVCGLLVRTIVAAQRVDVGMETRGLWGVRINFDKRVMPESSARRGIADDLLRRVRAIPAVASATFSVVMPPNFIYGMGALEIEGSARSPNDTIRLYGVTIAQPDYFPVTGTVLVAGRAFDASHALSDQADASEVVINESFAKRVWPRGNAIGARLRPTWSKTWWRVVGVARDIKVPLSHRRDGGIQIYQAAGMAPTATTILIRSRAPLQQIQPAVAQAIHDASARLRAQPAVSAESLVAAERQTQTYLLRIIGAFTVIALLLAAFGLHAVIAYSVGQRTREIGVRMALGAEAIDVLELVFGQGMRLAAFGIAIGITLGVLGARAVQAMLYQVSAGDPATIASVAALLAVVTLVSSYAPARCAATIDPVEALRAE
jgi:predicted permease